MKKRNEDIKEAVRGNPRMPQGFILRDYQIEAIEHWKNNSYHGILTWQLEQGRLTQD